MNSDTKRILIIGGSGFLSGATARQAIRKGHQVWAVTRGNRPLPEGVAPIVADRKDHAAFGQAIAATNQSWDLVVDCIGFDEEDVEQDISVLAGRTPHLVFISSDFVIDPRHRQFPQPEEAVQYHTEGYGARKRACEKVLIDGDTGDMKWTILRPCHIYGPGSKLGCLPNHGRDEQIISRIKAGETLQLVGGGHFLQQPIFVRDLADIILSCLGNPRAHNEIFQVAGPDIIESRQYYDIIADVLGVPHPPIEEVPVGAFLEDSPGKITFCCHRIYDLGKLESSSLAVPATPIVEGLREQVESLVGG